MIKSYLCLISDIIIFLQYVVFVVHHIGKNKHIYLNNKQLFNFSHHK